MLPVTLKNQSARSEYFAFPSPILNNKYVSHTSLYNGSCNRCVHNNRPNAPISKYSSTDVSILNINHRISKIYISILDEILHLVRAVPGVEFVILIPKTCSLYTHIKYSDVTHNTPHLQVPLQKGFPRAVCERDLLNNTD
jgi:hypothetical protein